MKTVNPATTSMPKTAPHADSRIAMDALAELESLAPPRDLPDPDLTENAVTVLERRYLKKDPTTGKVCETPRELFWRVAVKPGKPVAFGVQGAKLVFGLPGNPVSSLVACELFVRPALRALQGAADPGPFFLPGRLARALRCDAARDQLVRARCSSDDAGVVLEPITGQESHMIGRAAAAGALVLVPRGNGELAAGATVRYLAI